MDEISKLKSQIKRYENLENQWLEEREAFIRHTQELQQELEKEKNVNATLLKKAKHKRTSSQQHTFIFNQTNISSIYPTLLLPSSNWNCRTHIKAHLDSVRTVSWIGQFLITGSLDALVKIWEKDQQKSVIRQHMGPVFTISSNNQYTFTGGSEGVIRKWNNSDIIAGQAHIDEAEVSSDCIWEIALNPYYKNILVCSSADGGCKVIQVDKKLKQGKSFSIKNNIPTSVDWVSISRFISGYTKNNKLIVFDAQLGQQAKQYTFPSKQQNSQANKVVFNQRHKLIITAHEDRCIRFFDPNSNKMMKAITGHSDAVNSVVSRPQGYQIFSCGHDGSVRIWDLRKYRCVHDISVHMRKYDEAVFCLSHKKDDSVVAIGGADGQVKLLTPEH